MGAKVSARSAVQSPPQRIVALAVIALVSATGVVGLMPSGQEQEPTSTPTPEPDRLLAMHSPAQIRSASIREASVPASASTQLAMAMPFSRENELQPGLQVTSAPSPAWSRSAPVILPPPHLEIAADGLPVNGLRCTYDGGVFHCGDCRTDSDCPAGRGCVANRETRRFECMESECEEDAHCFPGFVCRRASRWETGPIVRRCMPVGQRSEGEPCDSLFVSTAGACQEGLICHRGVCSAPCQMEDGASCPQGYSCEEAEDGAACFPDCQVRGCPSGQRCKRLNDGDAQCLEQVQGECPEAPCAEGERCNMRVTRGRGVFWCARFCDPLRADSCPAEQICGVGGGEISTCYRRCDPMELDSCGEGQRCTTVSEDMLQWGCMPTASVQL
jgi:hypothetical protein